MFQINENESSGKLLGFKFVYYVYANSKFHDHNAQYDLLT